MKKTVEVDFMKLGIAAGIIILAIILIVPWVRVNKLTKQVATLNGNQQVIINNLIAKKIIQAKKPKPVEPVMPPIPSKPKEAPPTEAPVKK